MEIRASEIQKAGGLANWMKKYESDKHALLDADHLMPKHEPRRTHRPSQKATCPTEHQEQRRLIEIWDNGLCSSYGLKARQLFAIPNGGKRSGLTGQTLKHEGVRAGVPDLMLAYPCHGYNGLFIEMKKQHGGKVVPTQKEFADLLNDCGYKAVVCKGCDEALQAIEDYCHGRD